MSKFKQFLNKSGMSVKKHSPIILTTVGIIGLGTTAYLAYKSRDKVEAVIEGIEDARANDLDIDKMEVATGLAEALYAPVLVGAVSVAAIFMSYKIQSRRVTALAGALVAQQARNAFFEKKYRSVHGDDAYVKFSAPTEMQHETYIDDKGKTKTKSTEVRAEFDKTIGQWYDESSEYVSDDHAYNMAMIESVEERLQTLLFQRGSLLLNEVRDQLGFERIKAGALLGWTSKDSFSIDKTVNLVPGAGGEETQIHVSWSAPRYIHEEIDYNGRYAPHSI